MSRLQSNSSNLNLQKDSIKTERDRETEGEREGEREITMGRSCGWCELVHDDNVCTFCRLLSDPFEGFLGILKEKINHLNVER
jgi:hypothetical protein